MRKESLSILISVVLIGVLLAPMGNQWIHLIEDHHQEVFCSESKIHFHQKELNCDLNSTFPPPYSIYSLCFKERIFSSFSLKPILFSTGKLLRKQVSQYLLRGPPSLL